MADRIHAVQWRDDGLIAFKLSSGEIRAERAPENLTRLLAGFAVVEYRPWHRRLVFKFADDYGFECELGTELDPSPHRGRPVVYLDQNQWSTISKSLFAPHRVPDEDRRAAAQVLALSEAGQIILPLSAAHLNETSAWSHSGGRYELARTILTGSRGWQMRDVLAVRLHELRTALGLIAGLDVPAPRAVFTLEPNAALDLSARGGSEPDLPADIPAGWGFGYRSTLSNAVNVASLLDPEHMPKQPPHGWLQRVQDFDTWLKGERQRTKFQRRKAAQLFATADVAAELARAAVNIGASPANMESWIEETWARPIAGAPAVTLFRSVMVDKLLAGSRWELNDLTDLMYLCTAAAYADHVVGERRTIGLLRQTARRLGSPVRLHTNLASVVDALESTSVTTARPK